MSTVVVKSSLFRLGWQSKMSLGPRTFSHSHYLSMGLKLCIRNPHTHDIRWQIIHDDCQEHLLCTGYISFYAARFLFSVVFGKKARCVNLFCIYVSTSCILFFYFLNNRGLWICILIYKAVHSCFNNQSV